MAVIVVSNGGTGEADYTWKMYNIIRDYVGIVVSEDENAYPNGVAPDGFYYTSRSKDGLYFWTVYNETQTVTLGYVASEDESAYPNGGTSILDGATCYFARTSGGGLYVWDKYDESNPTAGDFISYVISDTSNDYPDDGVQNGYYYKRVPNLYISDKQPLDTDGEVGDYWVVME